MLTVITPNSPAQSLSRTFNHTGKFGVKTIALNGSILGIANTLIRQKLQTEANQIVTMQHEQIIGGQAIIGNLRQE
jgi:hypothetical protein